MQSPEAHGRRHVLGIIGPGEQATPRDVADAFEVAELAARAGWVVLTGGRDVGVMDAASRGARSADGIAVGVLPGADARDASRAVDIAIVTGIGEMRNQIVVLSSDAVVVCGMSAGTAIEVALAIKAGRPTVLVRPEPAVRAFYERIGGAAVRAASTPEGAMTMLAELKGGEVPRPRTQDPGPRSDEPGFSTGDRL